MGNHVEGEKVMIFYGIIWYTSKVYYTMNVMSWWWREIIWKKQNKQKKNKERLPYELGRFLFIIPIEPILIWIDKYSELDCI